MKRIYIVRHAKSSWADLSKRDHERPLNSRGRADAPVMARVAKDNGYIPQIIISSDAKRAKETAYAFAKILGVAGSDISLDSSLYHAPEDVYFDVVNLLDEHIASVALFGHNPGITYLANSVSEEYIDNVPTCGLLVIDSTATDWSSVSPANSQLVAFHYPKEMS